MKILHVVPEINEANGVYRVARMLAREQGGELIDCSDCSIERLSSGNYDEVWVHGMWLPRIWSACWKVLRNVRMFECSNARPKLVRMTHGSLSPIYLERQGKWKKRLVGLIERWLLRRADRVVATCEAEKRWIEAYEPRVKRVELTDLTRFFRFQVSGFRGQVSGFRGQVSGFRGQGDDRGLHVLYLGRRHPLKGVEFLEKAVEEVNTTFEHSEHSNIRTIDLRIVSDHFGEELEQDWAWCDVLCLPTLSENFGLVVAEALERGKRVVTTDGAPAWAPSDAVQAKPEAEQWRDRLVYLRGYREGSPEARVDMLKRALSHCVERTTG